MNYFYFSLYKNDLRISTLGKQIAIIRIKHFLTRKHDNFLHIIDPITVSIVLLGIIKTIRLTLRTE